MKGTCLKVRPANADRAMSCWTKLFKARILLTKMWSGGSAVAKRLSDILSSCSFIQYCPVWIFSFPRQAQSTHEGREEKIHVAKSLAIKRFRRGRGWTVEGKKGEDKSEMIHLSGNLDVGTEGAGRECLADFSKATRHLSVSPDTAQLRRDEEQENAPKHLTVPSYSLDNNPFMC